jgi:hypothetical protein
VMSGGAAWPGPGPGWLPGEVAALIASAALVAVP